MTQITTAHDRAADYDQLIHLLLDDLMEMLDGPIVDDERRWVLTLMDKLEEDLQAQFALEERDGYLVEVLERFPNWHPQLRHLREEHALLHQQFREIRELIDNTKPDKEVTSALRRHLTEWVDRFRQHQRRENEILQEAFTLDVGAGE